MSAPSGFKGDTNGHGWVQHFQLEMVLGVFLPSPINTLKAQKLIKLRQTASSILDERTRGYTKI